MRTEHISTHRPRRWMTGNVVVDLESQQVFRAGEVVPMRPKVWMMLCALLRAPGTVVPPRDLFAAIWPNQDTDPKLLVNVASELRQLLGLPEALRAVPRRGYVLEAHPCLLDPCDPSLPQLAEPQEDCDPHLAKPRDSMGQGFVGRGAILAGMLATARNLQRAETTLIDLVGPPGVGKTRLVDEFSKAFRRFPGSIVLRGAAVDIIGEREAFGPLIQMLEDHLEAAPIGNAAADLRRFAPCWLAQMQSVVDKADVTNLLQETQHASEGRMRREFSQLIRHWAKHSIILMVLEDLHWADISTLDWLESFLHLKSTKNVMVLTTRRTDAHTPEPADVGSLGRSRWMAANGIERIELAGFNLAETAAFVQQRLCTADVPPHLIAQLFEMTGGLPLLLDLACRHNGVPTPLIGSPPGDPAASSANTIASRLRECILQRVHQLPRAQLGLAQLASCSATAWPLPVLAQVLEVPVSNAQTLANRLVAKGIFKGWVGVSPWNGKKTLLYDFSHAAYREALRSSLSGDLKHSMCRRIGEVFLQLKLECTPDLSANMALVLASAGMHEEAANAFQAHSAHAMERFSSRQFACSMVDALVELEQTPRTTKRLSLQMEICWALVTVLSLEQGQGSKEVLDMQQRTLDLASEVRSRRAEFIKRITLCGAAFFRVDGRPDEAAQYSEALVSRIDELAPAEAELAWFWAGLVSSAQAKIKQATLNYQACLAVAADHDGLVPSQYRYLAEIELVWCLGITGDLGNFAQRLFALESECRARRNPSILLLTLFISADALRLLGCHDEALCRYSEVLDLCDHLEQKLLMHEALAGAEACKPHVARNLTLLCELSEGSSYGRHTAIAVLMETLLALGRTAEAQSLMENGPCVEPAWHAYTRTQMQRFEGELLDRAGKPDEAIARWYDTLRVDLQHRNLPNVIACVNCLRKANAPIHGVELEMAAWAKQIDQSLGLMSDLEKTGLRGLEGVRLSPLLAGVA